MGDFNPMPAIKMDDLTMFDETTYGCGIFQDWNHQSFSGSHFRHDSQGALRFGHRTTGRHDSQLVSQKITKNRLEEMDQRISGSPQYRGLGLLPMIFPFTFLAFAVLVTWSFYATSSLRPLGI